MCAFRQNKEECANKKRWTTLTNSNKNEKKNQKKNVWEDESIPWNGHWSQLIFMIQTKTINKINDSVSFWFMNKSGLKSIYLFGLVWW